MNKKNLAEGYNIFTGNIDNNHPFNTKFGEVHTGDAWVETKLLQKFTLGTDMNVSYLTVPVEAVVHPLCEIPDIGGDSNEYFVILPKKNWSRLFGNKIGV